MGKIEPERVVGATLVPATPRVRSIPFIKNEQGKLRMLVTSVFATLSDDHGQGVKEETV